MAWRCTAMEQRQRQINEYTQADEDERKLRDIVTDRENTEDREMVET